MIAGGARALRGPGGSGQLSPAAIVGLFSGAARSGPFDHPFDDPYDADSNPFEHPPHVEDSDSLRVLHRGYDCWPKCLGAGACSIFCGRGNACCRKGSTLDPPECHNVTDFWTDHHECVKPVEKVAVKHYGQDCWERCKIGGDCAWCGGGNACCRKNSTLDPPECHGIVDWPAESHHTCVLPVQKVEVNHEGQECYTYCKGNGHCNWCGYGNACCKYGDIYGPQECRAVVYYSSKEHHVCVKPTFQAAATPFPPSRPDTHVICPKGKILGEFGCVAPDAPVTRTFYMYRAVNAEGEASNFTSNINGASLGGVLYYLHKDVLGQCPRKNNIDRIRRFKVTMKNTEDLFRKSSGAQLGPYLEFVGGKCVSEKCNATFQDYGYVVGCEHIDDVGDGYMTKPHPSWYSFPGSCASLPSGGKSKECLANYTGGECANPTGARDCTFSLEPAGEVFIDELEGRNQSVSLSEWCAAGNKEYDRASDAGVGMDFWNGIDDTAKGQERMYKLGYLFWSKNPTLPKVLQEPCDSLESYEEA